MGKLRSLAPELRHRLRVVVSVPISIVLAVTLSACGSAGSSGTGGSAETAGNGSSAGAADATPIQLTADPCTLITTEEAQEALGISVEQMSASPGGGKTCNYFGGTEGHLAVTEPPPDFCGPLFLTLRLNDFSSTQMHITDIGDGGLLNTDEGNVQVRVNGGCLTIDAVGPNGPPDDDAMLALMRTAVSRLP
jgi:hypothetical protein